ncbi:MAG: 2,3-bisphosphoglycerate-independent phosphoglycerate mutase [Candidatus Vogelbacteria bacterium]|nr:2,3-bisphosphoglycerate-independent phosphoglycerate mutase [Candidatus Vogelbacteria bacterium]
MPNTYKPVALIVLDGWGYREETKDNAIAAAKKPFFDSLWAKYPHTTMTASGPAVGLPVGKIGSSETGHLTIGAGKIVDTDLSRINQSIADGSFASNQVLSDLFTAVKNNNSTLHLMGLIGPGGVHAESEHLFAILRGAKAAGLTKVAIHAFLDGRDTPPRSGVEYLNKLETAISEIGVGRIASLTGRYFAMDRDQNWDRLAKFLTAVEGGEGKTTNKKPAEILAEKYAASADDEHLPPIIFSDEAGQSTTLAKNDGIFIFNFRPDRVRMLTRKLLDKQPEMNWAIATMTEYDDDFHLPATFKLEKIEATLAGLISVAGLSQVHIAETEKFAHATYFLDGGREQPYPGEKQILIDSRKDVATHDQAPEMKAKEIADAALAEISAGTDFIFINFANADMVGHTANVPAIITAIETLDHELARVVEAVLAVGGVALVTADHGNAELNVDPLTGAPHTAHTTNPVPFILVGAEAKLKDSGSLANITTTVLSLLGQPKAKTMEDSLL